MPSADHHGKQGGGYHHRPASAGPGRPYGAQQQHQQYQPQQPARTIPTDFNPVEAQALLEQRWAAVMQQGLLPACRCGVEQPAPAADDGTAAAAPDGGDGSAAPADGAAEGAESSGAAGGSDAGSSAAADHAGNTGFLDVLRAAAAAAPPPPAAPAPPADAAWEDG